MVPLKRFFVGLHVVESSFQGCFVGFHNFVWVPLKVLQGSFQGALSKYSTLYSFSTPLSVSLFSLCCCRS